MQIIGRWPEYSQENDVVLLFYPYTKIRALQARIYLESEEIQSQRLVRSISGLSTIRPAKGDIQTLRPQISLDYNFGMIFGTNHFCKFPVKNPVSFHFR